MLNSEKVFQFYIISFALTAFFSLFFYIPHYLEILLLEMGLLIGGVNYGLKFLYQIMKEHKETHSYLEVIGRLEDLETWE